MLCLLLNEECVVVCEIEEFVARDGLWFRKLVLLVILLFIAMLFEFISDSFIGSGDFISFS